MAVPQNDGAVHTLATERSGSAGVPTVSDGARKDGGFVLSAILYYTSAHSTYTHRGEKKEKYGSERKDREKERSKGHHRRSVSRAHVIMSERARPAILPLGRVHIIVLRLGQRRGAWPRQRYR